MKHSIFNPLVYLVLALAVIFSPACNKDDHDTKTPCDNPVLALALNPNEGLNTHFQLEEEINKDYFMYSPTQLRVVNWSEFKSKIVPGKRYKIAYREVSCGYCGTETKDKMPICGYPEIICVELLCLTEEPCVQPKPCRNVIMEDKTPEFENTYSKCTEMISADGNKLKVKAYFSGCSADDNVQMDMHIQKGGFRDIAHGGFPIYFAKITETNNRMTCQAVFEKEYCFDLSPVKDFVAKSEQGLTNAIVIRIVHGNTHTDVFYTLK